MKVKVLQQDLSKALSVASRFASAKAQLPVLGNIRLVSSKNKLYVSSTNLEMSIHLTIGADVQESGDITVPARLIVDLVSNLKAGAIDLSVQKERLFVKTGNFSSDVSAMNSSDFPEIPGKIESTDLQITTDDLKEAISKTLFAASNDETRPVLTGVLMVFEENLLKFVATDGFRLSLKNIKLKKSIKNIDKLIIPKNSLSELIRLIGDEQTVDFSYQKDSSQIVFGIGDMIFSSRVIEGEFPNFEKIIPKNNDIKISLDKEEMLRSVRLASVFAKESANMLKLIVKKDALQITSESSSSGSQSDEIDAKVERSSGKEFVIAFNYRFLEEILGSIDSEEVQIEFSGQNSPGVFTDLEDKNFLHLIMPVKITS